MTAVELAMEMARRAEDQLTQAEILLDTKSFESVTTLADCYTRLALAYRDIAMLQSRDASRKRNGMPSATVHGRHAHSKNVPGGVSADGRRIREAVQRFLA